MGPATTGNGCASRHSNGPGPQRFPSRERSPVQSQGRRRGQPERRRTSLRPRGRKYGGTNGIPGASQPRARYASGRGSTPSPSIPTPRSGGPEARPGARPGPRTSRARPAFTPTFMVQPDPGDTTGRKLPARTRNPLPPHLWKPVKRCVGVHSGCASRGARGHVTLGIYDPQPEARADAVSVSATLSTGRPRRPLGLT